MKKILSFFIVAFFISVHPQAQNITGVWEAIMGREYLRLSIEQRGNELCGQTYDYQLNDKASYCKTYASGVYYPDRRVYSFTGSQFIINSGSHVLMAMRLWFEPGTSRTTLRGIVGTMTSYGYFSTTEEIVLRKISSEPIPIPAGFTPCFPEKPRPKNETVIATPPAKKPAPATQPKTAPKPPAAKPPVTKTQPKPPAAKPPVAQSQPKPPAAKPQPAPKPPVAKTTPVPPPAKKESVPTVKMPSPQVTTSEIKNAKTALEARRNSEQGRITISEKILNLKLYDNGEIDGDSVSVFYNGQLLVSKQRLTDKALEINIPIDPTIKEHKITLFADNLGSIPPNTALIVVTSGKNRYELRSKADLNENAVLVFEYIGDE